MPATEEQSYGQATGWQTFQDIRHEKKCGVLNPEYSVM